jgi:hypothetical protein
MEKYIPRILKNNETIGINEALLQELIQEKDSNVKVLDQGIKELQDRESEAVKIKESIKNKEIHTYAGDPMAGEWQFFSIPTLPECGIYKWVIKDSESGNDIYTFNNPPRDSVSSSIMEFIWPKEGNYVVTLYPQNTCGAGVEASKNITVLPRGKGSYSAGAPSGKPQVCAGEEVPYVAPVGYQSYEWQLPEGAQIVSDNPADARVTVKFGDKPGTVRVRATDQDGRVSLWTGLNVDVSPLPGNEKKAASFVEDEKVPAPKARAFTFVTREAAADSFALIQAAVKEQNKLREDYIKEIDERIAEVNKNIANRKHNTWQTIYRFAAILFALLGLVFFFSVLLSVIFNYILLYHFELFGYEQKEPHYWETLLSDIRAKNPRQPLLGIFVLLLTLAIHTALRMHCGDCRHNSNNQNCIQQEKIIVITNDQVSLPDSTVTENIVIPL